MAENNTLTLKNKQKTKLTGKKVWPYIFIAPFFIIYIAFNFYPLIDTFIISLYSWDGFGEKTFIGFENYRNIFTTDPYFLMSIKNTLIFMAGDIPVVLIGGILLAAVLNSKSLKGRTFFQTVAFLPYLTISVAIGVLFSLLFDWNQGTVNKILLQLGIIDKGINWLGDPKLARLTTIMMVCWKYIGYHMVFFNAGITGIDTELYEAADVDGAGAVTKFFKITIPLLRPTWEFLLVMNIIWGFQFFDEPKNLFSSWASTSGGTGVIGGPQRSCLTAIWNLYDTAFGTQMKYGKAAAEAYGLAIFICAFSIGTLMILKATRHDD